MQGITPQMYGALQEIPAVALHIFVFVSLPHGESNNACSDSNFGVIFVKVYCGSSLAVRLEMQFIWIQHVHNINRMVQKNLD